MTEEQIERLVERAFDNIDARLEGGAMTQAEYDAKAKEIWDWADRQYKRGA